MGYSKVGSNTDSKITIDQLTIDELKEQFEKPYRDDNKEFMILYEQFHGGNEWGYANINIQCKWIGYQECARANNVLKVDS